MSTVDRPKTATLPPLVAGQRLDRATFHERYEAMPPRDAGRVDRRSRPHAVAAQRRSRRAENVPTIVWLDYYAEHTPGVRAGVNASALLGGLRRAPARLLRSASCQSAAAGLASRAASSPKALNWSSRSPSPAAVSTSAPRRPTTSGPASQSIWSWRSTRTRSSGSSSAMAAMSSCPPGPDGLYRSEVFPGPVARPRGPLRRRSETAEGGR